ncbi:hypothetical protein OM428_15815 [Enterococcus gallinarum]|nr:hypothetical protein [Enterococcus gallinarum]
MGETIGRDLAITVLAPESGQGENEDSLVLKAEIEKWRFLFTGDLDQKGEEKLIQLYPHLQAEVVKLGASWQSYLHFCSFYREPFTQNRHHLLWQRQSLWTSTF